MLRTADLLLPADGGWGEMHVTATAPDAGTRWTDAGTERDRRGLKHRGEGEIRTEPIPPPQVRLFRAHCQRGSTGEWRPLRSPSGRDIASRYCCASTSAASTASTTSPSGGSWTPTMTRHAMTANSMPPKPMTRSKATRTQSRIGARRIPTVIATASSSHYGPRLGSGLLKHHPCGRRRIGQAVRVWRRRSLRSTPRHPHAGAGTSPRRRV